MQSLVHRRSLSSLLTVAPLTQRTLAFAHVAHKTTKDPIWESVCHAPLSSLARGRDELRHDTPAWVLLALAVHAVRSPDDAQSVLHDLALPYTAIHPCHALPLLTLTAHALAYYSLVALLRPLTAHLLGLPRPETFETFHLNMFLQAIALFDRSPVATDAAVDVLKDMESRGLALWQNTERVLIRDKFRTPQLLDYFRRREHTDNAQARLRAYASLGDMQSSAYCLDTIRKQCLDKGVPPPYSTHDSAVRGTAHMANTQYLRSMRDDRQSAFRYFHQLLRLDLAAPSHPKAREKVNIDIYDWTTALYAGAHDRTLSATALLDLFKATKDGTNAYRPTRATYTVVIQGLVWKNALEDAEKLWDEFVGEVVGARGKSHEAKVMLIDRKALCVGVDVLVRSGRTEEALYLLDEAVKKDMASSHLKTRTSYLNAHPIHALFSALLHIRRPDAIFYIWTHLTSLYFVLPTDLMLRILLKAAIQASKMDGESLKGAMSWYMADNRLFQKPGGPIAPTMTPFKPETGSEIPCDHARDSIQTGALESSSSRDILATHLRTLLQAPTPPVVGIWANRRSTDVARSIFRGMMLGNWPALQHTPPFGGGVTRARAKGNENVFQELARVWTRDPGRFLPPVPTHPGLDTVRPTTTTGDRGPPLPTVVPSERTFAAYIALLGLASRADEIPEVLVWMRALGVGPRTETLAVALVFWMEVGLRGPVFEDGWRRGEDEAVDGTTRPRTEYGALRAWIRAWVGEDKAPTEEDICAGIKRVREMREGPLRRRREERAC